MNLFIIKRWEYQICGQVRYLFIYLNVGSMVLALQVRHFYLFQTRDFGTYRICEQIRLWRDCTCSSPDTNDVSTGGCRQRFSGCGRDTPAGKCQRQAYWSSSAPNTSRRSEETRLDESETMLELSYREVIDVLDKQWKRSGLNDSMDVWIILCKGQIFI